MSEDGLDANTSKVKNSVDYVAKSGENITARAGEKRFSSKDSEKDVKLRKPTSDESIVKWVFKNISEILGRNE